jgi:Pentapeptide repeats (8 copies)
MSTDPSTGGPWRPLREPVAESGQGALLALQLGLASRIEAASADLRGADLAEAPFAGGDFTDADLREISAVAADFRGATLDRADFGGARLSGSSFAGAHGAQTNFAGADLTGCVLDQASFAGADFTGANLTGAVVDEVHFDADTSLARAVVTGLRGTIHGPLILDLEEVLWVLDGAHLEGWLSARGARVTVATNGPSTMLAEGAGPQTPVHPDLAQRLGIAAPEHAITAEEALRIAENAVHATSEGSAPVISLTEFALGYVVHERHADPSPGSTRTAFGGGTYIVDKSTGEISVWPSWSTEQIIERYLTEWSRGWRPGSGSAPGQDDQGPVSNA